MGRHVLGTNANTDSINANTDTISSEGARNAIVDTTATSQSQPQPTPALAGTAATVIHTVDGSAETDAKWVVSAGHSSCFNQEGVNGSANIPFLGTAATFGECESLCAKETAAGRKCFSCSWADHTVGAGWGNRCFGRRDSVWKLTGVKGVTSACDAALSACTPPPPPPPLPTTIRTFAHCSLQMPNAVAYAVNLSPCKPLATVAAHAVAAGVGGGGGGGGGGGSGGGEAPTKLDFPKATNLTAYWLSGNPEWDTIALNGVNLTASVGSLPALEGKAIVGSSVEIPTLHRCTVGFVVASYPPGTVAACN